LKNEHARFYFHFCFGTTYLSYMRVSPALTHVTHGLTVISQVTQETAYVFTRSAVPVAAAAMDKTATSLQNPSNPAGRLAGLCACVHAWDRRRLSLRVRDRKDERIPDAKRSREELTENKGSLLAEFIQFV
jgi:hypothetical protein